LAKIDLGHILFHTHTVRTDICYNNLADLVSVMSL
jgi:hypothetical protein